MKALRKRRRVTTDPADAYELANLLRLGSLPQAYVAPPELRGCGNWSGTAGSW